MEEGVVIYLAESSPSQGPTDELCRLLEEAGIRLSREQEDGCRIAVVMLQDHSILTEMQERITRLSQRDYRVIVINCKRSLSDLEKWQLLRSGAGDIIQGQKKEAFPAVVKARAGRWQLIEKLLETEEIRNKIIGDSREWKRILRKIIEVAYFTTSNILLMGPSGTGKELMASLIHSIDQRRDKGRMVLVDCTTLSPELAGSEFYGHERGAFTHAVQSRDGAFALADKGTIFLDELGELPVALQGGLLRVIQEGSYKRLGSNSWQQTKFRLVSATNRDLQSEMAKGQFREDLYYRVAGAVFTLPSLDQRKEDIPELVRHFLRGELRMIIAPEIEQTVMNYLMAREYPGNIRELKQLIARIGMRYTGEGLVTVGDLPEEEWGSVQNWQQPNNDLRHGLEDSIRLAIAGGKDLAAIKHEIVSLAIDIAMQECSGSLKLAARRLNVEVRTLQYIRKRGQSERSGV